MLGIFWNLCNFLKKRHCYSDLENFMKKYRNIFSWKLGWSFVAEGQYSGEKMFSTLKEKKLSTFKEINFQSWRKKNFQPWRKINFQAWRKINFQPWRKINFQPRRKINFQPWKNIQLLRKNILCAEMSYLIFFFWQEKTFFFNIQVDRLQKNCEYNWILFLPG